MFQVWASQVMLVVKNPPANAGDLRNAGSVTGLGRSPGGGNSNHSSILFFFLIYYFYLINLFILIRG